MFWPIWGRIRDPKIGTPFLIGLYYDEKKEPSNANCLLQMTVAEIKDILKYGLQCGQFNDIKLSDGSDTTGSKINIVIGNVCLDTPARCHVLGIKYYTGYNSCGRCLTEGEFKKNRLCFPDITASLRTDESFKNRCNPNFHKHDTILETIGVKCVTQVPLDVMHLVYLGVMRKMVHVIISCSTNKIRWSTQHLKAINDCLLKSKMTQPREFSRRIRLITDFGLFKATEFRTLLLYTGIIAFKDVLPREHYNHFLLLFTAIRILCSKKTCISKNGVAKLMLRQYVKDYGRYYGQHLISFNVHNLIHLADEVIFQNRPIDDFATWEFESYNCSLKKFAKKQRQYLEQAYNRVMELYNRSILHPSTVVVYPVLHKPSENELGEIQYEEIEFENFKLASNPRDRWFISTKKEIVLFDKVLKSNNTTKILGRKLLRYENMFVSPLKSEYVGVYESKNLNFVTENISFEIADISGKLFFIEHNLNKHVFIELL